MRVYLRRSIVSAFYSYDVVDYPVHGIRARLAEGLLSCQDPSACDYGFRPYAWDGILRVRLPHY